MINGSQISVAPQGRLLIRNICAVFDRYNQPVQNKAQFSRMIWLINLVVNPNSRQIPTISATCLGHFPLYFLCECLTPVVHINNAKIDLVRRHDVRLSTFCDGVAFFYDLTLSCIEMIARTQYIVFPETQRKLLTARYRRIQSKISTLIWRFWPAKKQEKMSESPWI